jgi:hypothetical protein
MERNYDERLKTGRRRPLKAYKQAIKSYNEGSIFITYKSTSKRSRYITSEASTKL